MRKILCVVLIFTLVFAQCATAVANTNNYLINNEYQGTIVDVDGNVLTSVIKETINEYIVEIYCNGKLDNKSYVSKNNHTAVLEQYDDNILVSTSVYDLDDFVKPIEPKVEVMNTGEAITPMAELVPTDDFTIENRYITNYMYKGSILYGYTKSMAKELSPSYRYEEHRISLTRGTAASVLIGILLSYFIGGITLITLAELGIPVAAGVLIDSVDNDFCFTKYRVVTKVWFDDILTVNAGNTYDKVLVKASAGGGVKFSSSYYGYDIVNSWASTCCGNGAAAFSDKYITASKPNLALPLTTIPYYS